MAGVWFSGQNEIIEKGGWGVNLITARHCVVLSAALRLSPNTELRTGRDKPIKTTFEHWVFSSSFRTWIYSIQLIFSIFILGNWSWLFLDIGEFLLFAWISIAHNRLQSFSALSPNWRSDQQMFLSKKMKTW